MTSATGRTPRPHGPARLPGVAAILMGLGLMAFGLGLVDARGREAQDASVERPAGSTAARGGSPLFVTSDECTACHNSLTTPAGEDISIGSNWRATMMANSARDPYWQASVRRETIDHPTAAAAIEDECATCHMPMARTQAHAAGRQGTIFAHLPAARNTSAESRLAHDGVSCSLCHQITSQNLGSPASFTGGFVILPPRPGSEPRAIFGPFAVEQGLTTVMHSSSGYTPAEAGHVRQSTLCATCHTLITKALGPNGREIGQLHEQTMYLEWEHSAFAGEGRSCQACHMPPVAEETAISSVLGQPRAGVARHVFVGGNSFVLRMLNRFRHELGVTALPQELEASVDRTVRNLQSATASVTIERAERTEGRLEVDVAVRNLTGHKLPTGYPSRRAWLHVVVRDAANRPVFESGAITPSGAITGNAADESPTAFEPHYAEIREPGQVQIYESVMADANALPTTGLLAAVDYLKDNRLLPRGFDKRSADATIATIGAAREDADFMGGGDHLRYSPAISGEGPFQVEVELRFQAIGRRWAENLRAYDAREPRRFVEYYDAMAAASSEVLARTSTTVR